MPSQEITIRIKADHPLDLDTEKVNEMIKKFVSDLKIVGVSVVEYSQLKTKFEGTGENA